MTRPASSSKLPGLALAVGLGLTDELDVSLLFSWGPQESGRRGRSDAKPETSLLAMVCVDLI